MILGIGTDIVELDRIFDAIQNKKFLHRCFTEHEILSFEQSKKISYLAGNFAAKEAFVKALGTGFRSIYPNDISILRDNLGKPYIILSQKIYDDNILTKNIKIHVSISHIEKYATSFVVLELA